MNNLEAKLVGAGYKQYINPLEDKQVGYVNSYQLVVKYKETRLYFIDIDLFDTSYWVVDGKVSGVFTAQLTTMCGYSGNTFNVELPHDNHEPSDVLEFFNNVYDRMSCVPYDN